MVKRNTKIIFWLAVLACLLPGLGRALSLSTPRPRPAGDIVINEFLASNGRGLTDEEGDSADWIELYNRGSRPVNLSGWSLTDDPTRPEKWSFPDISLNSGEYLLVFASGKNRRTPGAALHTNFRLRGAGDFLGLYRVLDQQFIDSFSPQFPKQLPDIAYGRYGAEAVFGYLAEPTPGLPNAESLVWSGMVTPVEFSVKRGFYDSPFTVTLTTATPGATIRYTTDGSEPTESHGQSYTGPVNVKTTTFLRAVAYKPNLLPAPIETHTYIFLDDVIRQPPAPPGFPPGADYEMDPRVVNDPRYSPIIRAALTTIPTISIVTDIAHLDIYRNAEVRGVEWERPVSVEFIDPDPSNPGFQVNAGVRIQGGVGRLKVYAKHSLRLFFKRDYGPTRLEYPIFPDSPVESFDTLILRGGVNRTFAGYIGLGDRAEDLRLTTYTRDEWLRASQSAMSGVGAHGIFVHLYLNGLYWGLYNVVERPDASFMAAYLGGQKEAWFAANQSGPVSGTGGRFEMVHELARQGNLADPERYAQIKEYLDIPQFIDYVILNFYAGNTDWAHNNWYAGVHNPAGRVNHFAWDGEKTWFDGAAIYLGKDKFGGKRNQIKPLVLALMQNPDFKMTFADRLYKHLFNDGALTDANAQARWQRINAPIELAIIGESARWGDALFDPPLTQADWRIARDNVTAQMEGNAARLIRLARAAGYYPELDPPRFSPQGGLAPAGFELRLDLPDALEGQATTGAYMIYYTTDGSDPRQPITGAIAPGALPYQSPLPLTTTTRIKTRLFKNSSSTQPIWSALNEATFSITGQVSRLQITELMYNPVGGAAYEFIELKNSGDTPIDLANMSFEGIRFTFPPKTPLIEPGQFIVLVHEPEAFAGRYPDVAIAGVYQGQLSNSGETISLKDAQARTVVALTYDDENGWPISPDGRGDSLVLVNPAGDPGDPKSWQASAHPNGSPGADELDLDR
jgi:hypothetical protein